MKIKEISLEEFDCSKITFDDLTYEKMVHLWCVSNFSDSLIAMKCGVPKDKISRLRRDKYKINIMNIAEHVGIVFGGELSLGDEADAIVAHMFHNGILKDLRITNDEMEKLIAECRKKMIKLLHLREEMPHAYKELLKQTHGDYCKGWAK